MYRKINRAAVIGEAGVCAHGAKDRVAGDGRLPGLFDEHIEDAADVLVAERGEAESARVAIDRRVVRELVFIDDFVGIAPVEEIVLDGVAIRMAANTALPCVALDVRGPASAAASNYVFDDHVRSSWARHVCPDSR